MSDEEPEPASQAQIRETNYRQKLIQARERKGLSEHEAATLMDFDVGYYDIESCDGDLTRCYSLKEILAICRKLGIHPRDLFCDSVFPIVPIADVIRDIEQHCQNDGLSISEFENIAGWSVEGCLEDPTKALDQWNVDCLIDVCNELKIEWRSVIESL